MILISMHFAAAALPSVKVSVTSTAKLGFTPRWSSHPACKGFNACNPTFYFTGIKSFKGKKVKLLNQPGYIIKLRQQIVSGHIWSCPHRFTHSWGGHMTWSTKTKTLPEAHVPLAMFCAQRTHAIESVTGVTLLVANLTKKTFFFRWSLPLIKSFKRYK